MTLDTFDKFEPPGSSDFLVPDLLSPWVNVLSGRPKSGKSLFAGYVTGAYLTGGTVLGRQAIQGDHFAYWAGFESGWRIELGERWQGQGWFSRLFYDTDLEPRDRTAEEWRQLGDELKSRRVGLAIIDSLYGVSGNANLDRAHEVKPIFDVFREWPDRHGIAVLLLAHAGGGFKGGDGSAAHSYAIEAEARHLLKLSKAKRRHVLKISGNATADLELTLHLDLDRCELAADSAAEKSRKYERAPVGDELWRLLDAGPAALKNASAAGRFIDPENPAAGRTKVNRWVDGELLARPVPGGPLVAGPKLSPRTAGG